MTAPITLIPHHRLQPSPLNPRKHARTETEIAELAASIADKGVLQNLVVRKSGDGYEIAAGEGRWRAVTHLIDAGKATGDFEMPVAVRELSDEDVIEIGLIENTQRNDLHPLDEARAYRHLVDAHAKTGGKKAAAEAVKHIADRVGRTARYVQQRVKLARDLIEPWQLLLDAGKLKLSVARILSSMPAKAQQSQFEDNFRGMTAEEIEIDAEKLAPSDFESDFRPMKEALFDVQRADLETIDVDGEICAVDTKAFDALQKEAAAKLTKDYRAKAKAGEIAFFDEAAWFDVRKYEQQRVEGMNDPTAGVCLVKAHDGFQLYTGLIKTEKTVKAEARAADEKKVKAKRAVATRKTEAKKLPPDPRIKVVAATMAKDERLRAALAVFDLMASFNERPQWLDGGGDVNDVREALTKRAGKAPPKGKALLPWLLEQSATALNAALVAYQHPVVSNWEAYLRMIETPSAAEQAIFDYCGAKLPDELAPTKAPKAGTAKRTASKSKPKPKVKKGKK